MQIAVMLDYYFNQRDMKNNEMIKFNNIEQ